MEYTILHLFCGIGGGALGFQQAVSEYKGIVGRFRTLAGIDCDPEACEDFEKLTGVQAVQMDLFSREDYLAFHGQEPPEAWAEVTPADIRSVTGGISPDVIFTSPPCKGFSGLLPNKSAKSRKYQALNRLTIRSLQLTLQAFADDLPSLILLENVPRITSRGTGLLREIKHLLGSHGYLFHEGYHDCGEIGGLGQRRKRYLLIARNQAKMSAFVYRPQARRPKAIGEVLGSLPLPDDPAMGPLHRLPRLQWKTWMRLALIPAGGDWRDLEKIAPEKYRLEYVPRGGGSWGVQQWDKPGNTVTGAAKVNGSNAANIADPRLPARENRHPAVYQVVRWDEPGPCVTGTRFGSGAPAVEDPRLGCQCRSGSYGVRPWDKPANTVTSADIHAGSTAVADPRIPADTEQGVWVIISEDGTWHRPLTTLELAALQGFPVSMPDGKPLTLAGSSDARWRERIGNAVPPPAAKAIAEQMLHALLVSSKGEWVLGYTGVWVEPNPERWDEAMI